MTISQLAQKEFSKLYGKALPAINEGIDRESAEYFFIQGYLKGSLYEIEVRIEASQKSQQVWISPADKRKD